MDNILTNSFILLIPVFIWNIIFTSKLPSVYTDKASKESIHSFFEYGEHFFRIVIFIIPLFIKYNILNGYTICIYIAGTLIYFISWLILIYLPESKWSKSTGGLLAPAYTAIIWLMGIALVSEKYYISIPYEKWHYIIPAVLFTVFHTFNTYMVLRKNS
jgi:hypothetical protein